jgi:hypothetical protein
VRHRRLYLAWLITHLLLIVLISGRDTLRLIAQKLTVVPSAAEGSARTLERITAWALGQNLAASNPARRTLLTYLDVAGIDRAYGYFAPNVPASYKLVFELHYPDGRIEYELPAVSSKAAGLRLASLLDEIANTPSADLREYLIKMLACSVYRNPPEPAMIRGVFGAMILPRPEGFERGERAKYKFLYGYDFSLGSESFQTESP